MGNQILGRRARTDVPVFRSLETETKRRRRLPLQLPLQPPLPPHIVQVIFSKLPVSNLPACRLVCKAWNDLILDYASSSKFLPNAAFLLSTVDFDPNQRDIPMANTFCNPKIRCIDTSALSSVASFEFDRHCSVIGISNSCNGLLYFQKETHHICCDGILNPMTNEFFKLPGPEFEDTHYSGLGFSPKTKRYKLFRISFQTCIMEAFRFGRSGTNHNHNQWRYVRRLPFDICYNGAYLNGVIYWIGKKKQKQNEYLIYALDVETENIISIAGLEVGPNYSRRAIIQSFNGSIYAIIFIYAPSPKILGWRMQAEDSWITDFVIHGVPNDWIRGLFHLVKVFEDGELLFLAVGDLFCLDNTGRPIKLKTIFNRRVHVLDACHMESLNFGSLSNILAGED